MDIRDNVCEMTIPRLYDAKKRQCEYSFLRYLDDLRERLEIMDDPALWKKYGKHLDETL